MQITLNEGQPAQQVVPTGSPAQAEPLSEAEVQALLERVPPLATDTGDVQEFRLASQPIPPPRPGETISQPFPPPAQVAPPSQVEVGPLEVLRYAPEGEVAIAPQVSVTFNQPMAPLGTLEALAAGDVPVQIEPALPGTWRWVGTKTLTFDYDSTRIDRLPMATEYTVTVPAGTRSQVGGVLDEAVSWTFTTPPPGVWSVYPDYGPQPLEPLFFVSFDQRIEPQAVLDVIQLLAGRKEMSLRLALPQEVQADERVRSLSKSTPEGRWLAFRAEEALPADTAISVTVGPQTPSAEGPLTQPQVYSFGFQTYAPLRIVEDYCGWPGESRWSCAWRCRKKCRPMSACALWPIPLPKGAGWPSKPKSRCRRIPPSQ